MEKKQKDSFSDMDVKIPRVTVLMSVYNGERYLRDAVDSVLNQTFQDFEFIIVNDGSTDGTSQILAEYAEQDPRIRVIHNQTNTGVTISLNKGLAVAGGKYIARMDADDISAPDRLIKQVSYMDTHPDIGALGSWVEFVDEKGVTLGDWRMPCSPGLIRWSLFFGNCMAHASVMMRYDLLEQVGFYSPEFSYAQDYDLWSRLSAVCRMANLPEILLKRRVVESSISSQCFQGQEWSAVKIMNSMIGSIIGLRFTREVAKNLRLFVTGSPLSSLQQVETTAHLIWRLYQAYIAKSTLNRNEAREVTLDAARKLHQLAIFACDYSLWKGFIIFTLALQLNPRLLSVRVFVNGMKAVARKAFQK